MKYKRIPLVVEAHFLSDGTILPQVIWLGAQKYPIERTLRRQKFHPTEVPCIAPWEYTVIIDNFIKAVYYEPSTGQWFSIKEVEEQL